MYRCSRIKYPTDRIHVTTVYESKQSVSSVIPPSDYLVYSGQHILSKAVRCFCFS